MQRQTRAARPIAVVGIIAAIAATILIVPPLRTQALRWLTNGGRFVTNLSWTLIDAAGWSTAIRQRSESDETLRQQLQNVTEELAVVRQQLETEENSVRLEDFLTRARLPSVAASVIGYSPDPGLQSLIINRGRDDQIEAGQAVITDDGWIVGKIQSVHETTATVLLLNDTQSIVLARIQNSAGSQGVVHGERGLAMRLDLIPKNDQVIVGQPIVTSGLEPGLPPDLLIGTVASIEQRSGEVFQRALITVPIRYGRVRNVAVVTL